MYSKCNGDFNTLIKTVGHRAHIFEKNDVEHTHLCQQFSYSHLSRPLYIYSCNKTLNMIGL